MDVMKGSVLCKRKQKAVNSHDAHVIVDENTRNVPKMREAVRLFLDGVLVCALCRVHHGLVDIFIADGTKSTQDAVG